MQKENNGQFLHHMGIQPPEDGVTPERASMRVASQIGDTIIVVDDLTSNVVSVTERETKFVCTPNVVGVTRRGRGFVSVNKRGRGFFGVVGRGTQTLVVAASNVGIASRGRGIPVVVAPNLVMLLVEVVGLFFKGQG
ncbi:hypothetical protein FXO38_30301 [Capsicum annuum]|nr:hypothetical protein FXO38_30301 [Capsicum annuum]